MVSEREQQSSVKVSRAPIVPVIESTSVAPRQRPKASQHPGSLGGPVGALPLGPPLQNTQGMCFLTLRGVDGGDAVHFSLFYSLGDTKGYG